jgi:hypothetical protein
MVRLGLLLALAMLVAAQTNAFLFALDGGVTAEDDWKAPRAGLHEPASEWDDGPADFRLHFAVIAQQDPELAYLLLLESGFDDELAFQRVLEASNLADDMFSD